MEAEWVDDVDHDAWAARRAQEAAEQARRESIWKARHPHEWKQWLKLQSKLDHLTHAFSHPPFDFDEFLKDVGRAPSRAHLIVRCDTAQTFRRGNLRWAVPMRQKPRRSPYLNAQEAADFLGIALRTLYNNRKHIPSLPGFKKLMFDPKSLREIRSSQRFRTLRLARS
jgi:hypothetical protein